MVKKEETLLIEYEIELAINKQMYQEKRISYDVFRKVANSIIKDIENQMQKLESMKIKA